MDQTTIKTLYVFVEIAIDSNHLSQTVRLNLPDERQVFSEALLSSEDSDSKIPAGQSITNSSRYRHLRIESTASTGETQNSEDKEPGQPTRLALVSTIQFAAALQKLKEDLSVEHSDVFVPSSSNWTGKYDVTIPRSKPLSPGEILGCTAPKLDDVDALMYDLLLTM